jgi:hypothetical protein
LRKKIEQTRPIQLHGYGLGHENCFISNRRDCGETQMKNDSQFELIEPFEADDGSLRGLRPAYVFALGVEWAMFLQKLGAGTPFTTLCLPENRTRFVRMAERHNRFVEDRQTNCTGWIQIWVGDVISSESNSHLTDF